MRDPTLPPLPQWALPQPGAKYYDDARVLCWIMYCMGMQYKTLAKVCQCRKSTAWRWTHGIRSPYRPYRRRIMRALRKRGVVITPEIHAWCTSPPIPTKIELPDDIKSAEKVEKEIKDQS